jgi:luciferase family oxidoreductase group 1
MWQEPKPDVVVNAGATEGSTRLRLGVLDLCPAPPDTTGRAALFDSLETAVRVEALGFSRYWLAEHHGPGTAHSCPEILVGLIAQMTEHIRVGTAGILLNYYSPLKVAKTFRLLQALFPGRIDLGVGAGGVDEDTARGLIGDPKTMPDYAGKVRDLAAYLHDDKLPITPRGVGVPEMWVLGSGGLTSALTAARNGTAYGLALFLPGGKDDPAPIEAYRSQFHPSPTLARPQWNIAVAGVCADTDEEALRLCALHRNSFLVPTVVGGPEQCRAQLQQLSERYQTDEIIFVALSGSAERRLRSYELLAQVFELRRSKP